MRAVVVLAAAMLVPVGAAAPATRVVDSESVGGYRLTQSRSRAIDAFGAPTLSHSYNLPQGGSPVCRTYWRSLRLVITYLGECSFTGRAWRATVEGNGWRTREGLRIGDVAKRITRVYRGAKVTRRPSPAAVIKWTLMPLGIEWDLRRARPSSSVIVATQSGKVVGFELRPAELRSG